MNEERKKAILSDCMELISASSGLGPLCELAESVLGLPVAITMTTRTIITHSKGYSKELLEEYSEHLKYMTPEEIRERNTYVDSLLSEKKAFCHSFPMMKFRHISCGCYYHNDLYGVLDIPVIDRNANIQEVMETAELLAPVFLTMLRLSGYVTLDMKFSMQVYLSGLLNGDPKEWIQIHHISDSELNTISQWMLIYLPRVFEDKRNNIDDIHRVCARYRFTWAIRYGNDVVILKKAYEHFNYEKLLPFIGKTERFSVSEPFSDLSLIINYLHSCQRTIDLAAFEKTEERILFVENYKMAISYLVLKQMPNGMLLYHPAIPRIKEYDEKNQTEYYDTLVAYLLNKMDRQVMAEKLHIHKNTVVYRLQKLEELFHLDLKDIRTTTGLYLSLFENYRRR